MILGENVSAFRLLLVSCLALAAAPAGAAWQTTEAPREGDGTVAFVDNERGQRAEIFLDDHNTIFLRMTLGDGFETFAATNCPTFQIDDRRPMHHFDVGDRCEVATKRVTFNLGQIADQRIESLILHRLMNGNNVTFRYTVGNGQYGQARFSLTGSKQAFRRAIGFNLRIDVD